MTLELEDEELLELAPAAACRAGGVDAEDFDDGDACAAASEPFCWSHQCWRLAQLSLSPRRHTVTASASAAEAVMTPACPVDFMTGTVLESREEAEENRDNDGNGADELPFPLAPRPPPRPRRWCRR